jgi:Ca2+-binding EF-hand superfamily protein
MSKKAVSAAKAPEPVKKAAFDIKAYARGGVTEEEVAVCKQAFDLFDNDQGGSVDISGIFSTI